MRELVNGAPITEVCYVAVRGGDQVDSDGQLLQNAALPWADEDKGKYAGHRGGLPGDALAGGRLAGARWHFCAFMAALLRAGVFPASASSRPSPSRSCRDGGEGHA